MATSLVSVRIRDNDGYTAVTDAYVQVDPLNTVAQLNTAFGSWLTLLQAATAGRIIKATLKLGLDVSGFSGHSMTAGIPVSAGAALIFPTTTGAPWDFVIPARAAAVIVGGKPDVSTEGSTLDLLADFMEVGIAGLTGTSSFTSNLGAALGPTAGGRLITRKHRSQLQSRSTTTGV